MCHSPSCLYHCSEGRQIKMPFDGVDLLQFLWLHPINASLIKCVVPKLGSWEQRNLHWGLLPKIQLKDAIRNTVVVLMAGRSSCCVQELFGIVLGRSLGSPWTLNHLLALGCLGRKKRRYEIPSGCGWDAGALAVAVSESRSCLKARGPGLFTCAGFGGVPRGERYLWKSRPLLSPPSWKTILCRLARDVRWSWCLAVCLLSPKGENKTVSLWWAFNLQLRKTVGFIWIKV